MPRSCTVSSWAHVGQQGSLPLPAGLTEAVLHSSAHPGSNALFPCQAVPRVSMGRAAGSAVTASTALAVTPPPGAAGVPPGCGASAVTQVPPVLLTLPEGPREPGTQGWGYIPCITQAARMGRTERGASISATAPAMSPVTRSRGAACVPRAKPAPGVLQVSWAGERGGCVTGVLLQEAGTGFFSAVCHLKEREGQWHSPLWTLFVVRSECKLSPILQSPCAQIDTVRRLKGHPGGLGVPPQHKALSALSCTQALSAASLASSERSCSVLPGL